MEENKSPRKNIPSAAAYAIILLEAIIVLAMVLYLFDKVGKELTVDIRITRRTSPVNINNQTKSNINSNINTDGNVNEAVDISDWITYVNNKYDYEFKYPKEWVKSDISTDEYLTLLDEEGGHWILEIDVKNKTADSLVQWLENNKSNYQKEQDIKVAGYDGVMAKAIGENAGHPDQRAVVFFKDSKEYDIYSFSNDLASLQEILGSFKFTE